MSITLFLKRVTRSLAGAIVLSAALFAASAIPTKAQGLDEIVSKKKIVVGMIQDFPPFGFINAEQKPEGYDVDVAKLLGTYLGVEVEFVPVSGANRIPYLLSKRVDVLIASLGITPERAKQVMFTIPYAATQSQIVAPADKKISSIADLKGLNLAVARGSSNDIFITKMAPEGVQVRKFDGEGATSQAMSAGQVDAIVMTNTMLAPLLKAMPDANLETKLVLQQQENAIAVRREDTELSQWINTFIYYIKNNGELNAIHQKWLESPLPTLRTF